MSPPIDAGRDRVFTIVLLDQRNETPSIQFHFGPPTKLDAGALLGANILR
jgi:hypothetical protein